MLRKALDAVTRLECTGRGSIECFARETVVLCRELLSVLQSQEVSFYVSDGRRKRWLTKPWAPGLSRSLLPGQGRFSNMQQRNRGIWMFVIWLLSLSDKATPFSHLGRTCPPCKVSSTSTTYRIFGLYSVPGCHLQHLAAGRGRST